MASGTQYSCNYYLITSATSIQIIIIMWNRLHTPRMQPLLRERAKALRDSSACGEQRRCNQDKETTTPLCLSWLLKLKEHSNTS